MTVTCYKAYLLAQGYVNNSYEVDESFTGLIIDNGGVKKKLHYPFKLHIYDTDVIIKDIDGKSYRVDPSTVDDYNTITKLLSYINSCIESDYYEEFSPAGDEITVNYDLSGYLSWTKDSINDSIALYLQGGIKAYYDGVAFTAGNNYQFQVLAGNVIKFPRAQLGKRVQVQIKNRFKI